MKTQIIKLQDKFILVSDEEIKKGDWYYNFDYNYIKQCVEVNKKFVKNALFYEKDSTVFDYSKDCKKIIAGIPELPRVDFSDLKEEDCKTIGWVDVEKLWLHFNRHHNNDTAMGKSQFLRAYEYITAQPLNDKMFGLEDIEKAFDEGLESQYENDNETIEHRKKKYIQSLQQTEWDVEVETECGYGDKCPSEGDYDKQHLCKIQPKITNNSIKIIKIL